MLRLIDADALRTRLEKNRAIATSDIDPRSQYYALGMSAAILIISGFPTIDPESLRQTAQWKKPKDRILLYFDNEDFPYELEALECSNCGSMVKKYDCDGGEWKYCPACGARMEKE